MKFSKGDRVRVWGDKEDIATVKGISKQFVDRNGNQLIELQDGSSITQDALEKCN